MGQQPGLAGLWAYVLRMGLSEIWRTVWESITEILVNAGMRKTAKAGLLLLH